MNRLTGDWIIPLPPVMVLTSLSVFGKIAAQDSGEGSYTLLTDNMWPESPFTHPFRDYPRYIGV